MLLKYAWQNDYCFPGQERLAKDMGVTDRSIRTYLQELEREHFVAIKQRGLGKPNLYELNLSASAADRKNFPVKTVKKRPSRPEKFSD
jgi:predicted ArsR family transcriptional regulator